MKKGKNSKNRKKLIIILCAAAAVVTVLAVFLGIYINKIFNAPEKLFSEPAKPSPTPTVSLQPDDSEEEVIELSEYDKLVSEADKTLADGILNVVLVGVDHAEERDLEEWDGKRDFHADVILILAINFNENTVDMISVPRDTYANIPGSSGIYKINASMDLGGGMYDENGGGFLKVCETAEWMLGGLDVDYYVGVDMNAVKDLGNAIGGVDFDLEVDFNLSGRYYKAGMQHMDGQGILDYMRVRKPGNIAAAHQGDQKRVNRQKKMLVAVFETMKSKNMLVKIPDIIEAFDGNMYTNLSNSQLAALALFAYDNLDAENISMHSMGGTGGKIGEWNFVFTNQKNRVDLIKEIYGIDVEKYTKYTEEKAYERYYSIGGEFIISSMHKILDEIKALHGFTDPRDIFVPGPAPAPSAAPSPSQEPAPTPSAAPSPSQEPAPTPSAAPSPSQEPTPTPSAAPSPSQEPAPAPSAEPMPSAVPEPQPPAAAQIFSEQQNSADTLRSMLYRKKLSVPKELKEQLTLMSSQQLFTASVEALEAYKLAPSNDSFDVLKETMTALCNSVAYPTRGIVWYYPFDEEYNKVFVDFR